MTTTLPLLYARWHFVIFACYNDWEATALPDNDPPIKSPDTPRRRRVIRRTFIAWEKRLIEPWLAAHGIQGKASDNVIVGAQRLRALMEEASITSETLASKTGLSLQTIKQYLRGFTQPRKENLKRVSAVLTEDLKRQIKPEDIFPNVK